MAAGLRTGVVLVVLVVIGLPVGLWAGPALAQGQAVPPTATAAPAGTDPTESPAYTALIEEAVREYAAQNFPEARSLFTRAFALSPNARVLRGLGMAEFELRNYPRSVDYLRRALASQDHPLDGELRVAAQALLLRAERFVVAVPLVVTPANATLLVDGQPAMVAEDGALVLQVGDHSVEFTAPGYKRQLRTVNVTGAEPTPLEVTLEAADLSLAAADPGGQGLVPVAGAPAGATSAAASDSDGGSLLENPFLWGGIGVGAAIVAVVLVVSLSGGGDGDPTMADPIASNPVLTLQAP